MKGVCSSLVAAMFVSAAAISANAQNTAKPMPELNEAVEVGTTVICDTQAQMERFVVVFDGNYENAMKQVNDETGNETACIGATMAFMRGDELSKASNAQGAYHIIRVLVLGINTDEGFLAIQPTPFVSLVKSDVEQVEV